MRMGFTRFNLPYFASLEEIDYIIDGIEFVCRFGWMFLPNYKFDVDLGIWVSRDEKEQQTRVWLGEIDYSTGMMGTKSTTVRKVLPFELTKERLAFKDYLELAKEHLVKTVENYKSAFGKSGVDQLKLIPEEYKERTTINLLEHPASPGYLPGFTRGGGLRYKELIWFLFPSQVLQEMMQLNKTVSYEQLLELSSSKQTD